MNKLKVLPGQMPAANKLDRTVKFVSESAFAECLIGKCIVVKKEIKICSIMFIENNTPGNGAGSRLINRIDGYARQCRCNEMWFPTVLSVKLAAMLIKKGYHLERHQDQLFGEVEVYVKEFKKK